MSSNGTSSQVGKRQRLGELDIPALTYDELLEDYTETARGISFGRTVAEGVIISSYILTYASRSAKVPVLTVRLKEGCEDKGIGTFGLQEQLLLFLKEYETPSKLLLKLQETQPNVFAIGINNSIREFRCPEWLSVCSPKGVFFLFSLKHSIELCLLKTTFLAAGLLHDHTTSVAYYGKIPVVINCYDNGGRATEANSNLEVVLGDRHQNFTGKRRTAHLQNTVFRTLDGLKGQFAFVKTFVIEMSTECTIKELMATAAKCMGVERMAIGIHEHVEHRFPNSARLCWHQNEHLEFSSIHSHYGDPLFPYFPFVYAVSHAGNPTAGMIKDIEVHDHTSDLYNVIRENARSFNSAAKRHETVEQVISHKKI